MGPQKACGILKYTVITFGPILLSLSIVVQAFAGVGVVVIQQPHVDLPWDANHRFGLVGVCDKTNLFEQLEKTIQGILRVRRISRH